MNLLGHHPLLRCSTQLTDAQTSDCLHPSTGALALFRRRDKRQKISISFVVVDKQIICSAVPFGRRKVRILDAACLGAALDEFRPQKFLAASEYDRLGALCIRPKAQI